MNRDFGEVPGYEFEAPGRSGVPVAGASGADLLRAFRPAAEAEPPAVASGRLASRVLSVMRARNWLISLVLPIFTAVIAGVVAVTVAGGGAGGDAPSALAAGFPPARLAGADFAGAGGPGRAVLAVIAASPGTEVVAGGAGGGPALWASTDGGSTWRRAALAGLRARRVARRGQFTGVAHGADGWLAVGGMLAGRPWPLVASSPDGRTWTVSRGVPAARGAVAAPAAVAASRAGYVIVGRQRTARGTAAAAWYARGLAGWHRGTVAGGSGAVLSAVAATSHGFTAVGSAGSRPAAWLSAAGRSWRPVSLPMPDGAIRAALDYVAARGADVVAAGTEVSAHRTRRPFAVVSADGGATWTLAVLPLPASGTSATTVTALAAAGGGFTAAGNYDAGTADGTDVVVWTLPSRDMSGSWRVAAPQGTGLSGPGTQAITALTAQGATLTGVGFTAPSSAERPTLWQSPIRY